MGRDGGLDGGMEGIEDRPRFIRFIGHLANGATPTPSAIHLGPRRYLPLAKPVEPIRPAHTASA